MALSHDTYCFRHALFMSYDDDHQTDAADVMIGKHYRKLILWSDKIFTAPHVPYIMCLTSVMEDLSYILLNNIIYTFLYSCHMSNIIKIHQWIPEILIEVHINLKQWLRKFRVGLQYQVWRNRTLTFGTFTCRQISWLNSCLSNCGLQTNLKTVLKIGDHSWIQTHKCLPSPCGSRSVTTEFLSASIHVDGTPYNSVKPEKTYTIHRRNYSLVNYFLKILSEHYGEEFLLCLLQIYQNYEKKTSI
jgi:hypothetical protein